MTEPAKTLLQIVFEKFTAQDYMLNPQLHELFVKANVEEYFKGDPRPSTRR